MKIKRTFLACCGVAVGFALLALQGCSGSGGSYGPEGSWGNYKCTAASGHQRMMGWAASGPAAKRNALDKCRATSMHPAHCHILHCMNEGN